LNIIDIEDADDERLLPYRNLKDAQSLRAGHFIAEGRFILEVLLMRSRFEIASILLREDRLGPLQDMLVASNLALRDAPILVAKAETLAAIAGYDVHRGILAAVRADPLMDATPALKSALSLAVLCNIANPDNIGAIFRNAAALGIGGVVLDAQCCSPLYRKAVRVSMGAVLTLPWHQANKRGSELVQDLKVQGFVPYAMSLSVRAQSIDSMNFQTRSAFVFGEEAHGLPDELVTQCQPVIIPMAGGTDSLNVAASSAIVFDHWRRSNTAKSGQS
jgi:tRNA G18 (ribose-2'-O)-methylase SpoU